MRLTEPIIRTLPSPLKGNKVYYEDDVHGFGLRVTQKGVRSFVLNYRIDSRERRLTIGRWPEWNATAARERARELRRDIDRGVDPLALKRERQAESTFAELVAEYLATDGARQKNRDAYERMLKVDALPHWGRLRVSEIRRRDVIALIEQKAIKAPVGANRLFELVRRVFNFAIRREVIEANPCTQVKKPAKEQSRDRVLSADELRALWEALDGPHFTEAVAAALRMILVTAQRPGEVVGMCWQELDLEVGIWTISAARAKNGLAHRVPLNSIARETLKALPKVGRFVFPSPNDGQPMHRNALALALRRSRDRMHCRKLNRSPLAIAPFTPHDLRRSAASHMASAGVQRFVIGQVLNHVESGVTRVYDRHSYDQEKRHALDQWGCLLQSLLGGERPSANVVSIGGPR